MDTFDAVMIAEGCCEATEDTYIAAYQTLIDNGMAWSLQGAFGRQAARLIEEGYCTPATGKKA
jgi:hypothetical protein